MSSSEDQELMAKISSLAGKINRHKAHQTDAPPAARAGYHRAAPYQSRGYRGARGGHHPYHRHKTLVLNGQSAPAPTGEPDSSSESSSTWVSKNDRHMQLINTAVYEKEAQARASAIGESQRQRQTWKNNLERAKIAANTPQQAQHTNGTTSPRVPGSQYEMIVEGIRFRVVKEGDKLVKSADDVNPPNATPKTTYIGGVRFHRTRNGNLVRHGIVKAQRLANGIKKVNEQCKAFSWNGVCPKGPNCRYLHDITKVGLCRRHLKGSCPDGDNCDLSHDITEERTPLCLHFAKGNCSNPSCAYIHADHSSNDPVCRAFGIYGYCEKGAKCADRHVLECPDFSNTGVCKTRACKRPHIERASVLRRASMRPISDAMDDVSSDDEAMAADSDDVDSDEVEEFIGQDDDVQDPGISQQKDFIEF